MLFAVALAVLLSLALLPVFPHQVETREGDTASRTWQAPRDFSFESEVLTEKQREQAAAAVPDVLVFSSDVKSEQMAKLDKLITDVESVRGSTNLTRSQKLSALRGTENLFAPDYESFILDMPATSGRACQARRRPCWRRCSPATSPAARRTGSPTRCHS